jgi:hypothetical protein
MVVALIIGGAALGTVTYYTATHCWTPEHLKVAYEPDVVEEGPTSITVTVNDADGTPVQDASVSVTGLGAGGSNTTNAEGTASVRITSHLPEGRREGYLDIMVTAAGCYKQYSQDDAIKVVKG